MEAEAREAYHRSEKDRIRQLTQATVEVIFAETEKLTRELLANVGRGRITPPHEADPDLSLNLSWRQAGFLMRYSQDEFLLFGRISGSDSDVSIDIYGLGPCLWCDQLTVLGPPVSNLPELGGVLTAGMPIDGHTCSRAESDASSGLFPHLSPLFRR